MDNITRLVVISLQVAPKAPKKRYLRERCLSLLNVLALVPWSSFPTEVDGDAHEEPTLVKEKTSDIHGNQQQEEDNNQDSYNGSSAQP